MARTPTRNSSPSRKRDRPQSTGAFWFLVGTLVGAFGVGLAWMNEARTPSQPSTAQTKAPAPKPTFDFYESLPQEEVLVPVEESVPRNSPMPPPKPETTAKAPPAATKTPPPAAPTAPPAVSTSPPAAAPATATATKYQLQVGSFRDMVDAERRKAELALLGLSVNIVKAQVGGAATYRLRTGSLDKSAAGALGKKLQSQGVSSMAIKAN